MRLFDTHTHVDDKKFDEDREVLLNSLPAMGIDKMVNVGATMESSKASIELAHKYPWIYAAIGVHPHDAKSMISENLQELKEMAKDPKVVAIGEIGLDYHYDLSPREAQRKWFVEQMKLANEVSLPFIVHSREASEETYELIRQHKGKAPCLLHCYSQSVEMAKRYVQMGVFLSVGGPLTFKSAKTLKEVVKEIPLEWIFLETDCPYLSPEPYRGKRNDPGKVLYVAKAVAQIKGMTVQDVAEATRKNAMDFFGIA